MLNRSSVFMSTWENNSPMVSRTPILSAQVVVPSPREGGFGISVAGRRQLEGRKLGTHHDVIQKKAKEPLLERCRTTIQKGGTSHIQSWAKMGDKHINNRGSRIKNRCVWWLEPSRSRIWVDSFQEESSRKRVFEKSGPPCANLQGPL